MMHSLRLPVACQRLAVRARTVPIALQSSTQTAKLESTVEEDEYWDEPRYPIILDTSISAKRARQREGLYAKIRKLKTVEQKQIALNMPRYYGFKCIRLLEDKVPYNAMPLVQCYTRTHFISKQTLPEMYTESEEAAALVAKEIRLLVEEALSMEYHGLQREFKYGLDKPELQQAEDAVTRNVAKHLNRIITNNLADKLPHILSAQVDFDPRHEAFWFVGGVYPTQRVVESRKSKITSNDTVDSAVYDPIDRAVQYTGSPLLTLRSNQPLRPLILYSEVENPSFTVPKYPYQPEMTGYLPEFRHGTNIPGFWPGDQDEFGLLSIHGRGHILTRKESYGAEDNLEALHCQAMKSSFGWLLAQASYQGFDTFNDITYPLVTQTAITNGQLWSLYSYQLNTIKMHNEHMDENAKKNICFGTPPQKLFEGFDDRGNVVGFNEDVLKQIVQLYMNTPEARDYDMKPYLGEEEQVIADIENDHKRNWLERTYKHLVANRPRHLLAPETYQWEWIYKIKYNTKPMDARRRPFELGINPFKRRLDEHVPLYIPKCLRPYPRSKKKWETMYYPDVKPDSISKM